MAKAIDNGTYKDVYKIGDTVPLDLGSEGVINMQIAAFDADTLADGSGTAAISWVGKELLNTTHRMNPERAGSSDAYTEGTGSIGGWEKCELRAYLQNAVKPLFPNDVEGMIQSVKKKQRAYTADGLSFTQTTDDDIWLLSKDEVKNGGFYSGLFVDSTSRKKEGDWWLRSAGNESTFDYVNTYGNAFTKTANNPYYVCIGFCT